jgi:hypothetical protein
VQITAINTNIMFIDDECKCECKCEPQKTQTVTKPEIKPNTDAKPQLKEPLKQDTVEISAKKPEQCVGGSKSLISGEGVNVVL